jgi:glyoxylase I family protein
MARTPRRARGIVNSGIKDAHYGSGLSFRDPDGIALEFFAPPA